MAVRVNAAVMAALVAASGCAGAQRPGASEMEVRAVGRCEPETYPASLPRPGILMDTAALGDALHELSQAEPDIGGHVVLSLEYLPDGVNTRRAVVEHSLTPAVADSIQKLVFAHREPGPAMEQAWGARLRVNFGDQISYDIERRVYCPPRPRSQEMEAAMREFVSTGVTYQGRTRYRTALMEVGVHPAGYVTGARAVRGEAPGSSRERELTNFIRQFSFDPATIDGIPVFGTIVVPVRYPG